MTNPNFVNIDYSALTTTDLYTLAVNLEENVAIMRQRRFQLSLEIEEQPDNARQIHELTGLIEILELEASNAGRQYKARNDHMTILCHHTDPLQIDRYTIYPESDLNKPTRVYYCNKCMTEVSRKAL